MIYLSSTTGIPDEYKWDEFGVMFSVKYAIGGLANALDDGALWMMDNNAFSGDFDAATWLAQLLKYRPYAPTCLGIPIPDVVGDALATLRLFGQYWRIVADLDYPVAFVSQDGITPEVTPWNWFDVLFIGGTDDHKLGNEAGVMIAEAKQRDKRVHVGRVNSEKRIKQFWMCDSVDGTYFSIRARAKGGGFDNAEDRLARDAKYFANAVQWCRNRKNGNVGISGQYRMGINA